MVSNAVEKLSYSPSLKLNHFLALPNESEVQYAGVVLEISDNWQANS